MRLEVADRRNHAVDAISTPREGGGGCGAARGRVPRRNILLHREEPHFQARWRVRWSLAARSALLVSPLFFLPLRRTWAPAPGPGRKKSASRQNIGCRDCCGMRSWIAPAQEGMER